MSAGDQFSFAAVMQRFAALGSSVSIQRAELSGTQFDAPGVLSHQDLIHLSFH